MKSYLSNPIKNILIKLVASIALVLISATFSGFKYEPQKGTFVSLSPFITEIIYELEAEDNLIGVTSWSDYPEQVKNKPQLGNAFQINKEEIIKVKPEYVLALARKHEPIIDDLSTLGIKIIYFHGSHLSDVYDNIEKLGKITGKEEKAKILIKKIKETLAVTKAKKKKRILYVVNPEPLMVVGKSSYISELLREAGHENVMDAVLSDYYGPFPVISYEFAIDQSPDLILIAHFPEAAGYIKNFIPNAEYKYLDYEEGSILIRAGPRITEAIKILSEL